MDEAATRHLPRSMATAACGLLLARRFDLYELDRARWEASWRQ